MYIPALGLLPYTGLEIADGEGTLPSPSAARLPLPG